MKKTLLIFISLIVLFFVLGIILDKKEVEPMKSAVIEITTSTIPVTSSILISPEKILPGDPILITIVSSSTPLEIAFDDKPLPIFSYKGNQSAFVGIDFNEKVLEHIIKVKLADGTALSKPVILTPREKIELPLGIPDKLGGNTPEAEKALLANLARENEVLNTVKTATTTLWSEAFGNPLATIFITDDYGYDRKTVNSTIVHKGTDFRAAEGTQVLAMNSGIVRVARAFTVYGNSIIIDHGQGVQTLYMHLSKLSVKEGDVVKTGQIIGLSGKTGYAESPHLHISVKINKISIDPMTFLRFFNNP